MAWQVHNAKDFKLPKLKGWNYDPCRKHRNGWDKVVYNRETDKDEVKRVVGIPNPKCNQCGFAFMDHQRIAVAWMYLKKSGLLADTPGLGKTISAAGLVSMLYATGEIPDKGRALIVPRAPALYQWKSQLLRAMPGLSDRLILMDGGLTQKKRKELYLTDWDVALIGPEMLRNDYHILEQITKFSLVLSDDVDQLRNPDTDTSYVLDRMGRAADRYFIMTGSPLQKKLPELHSVLDAVGGERALGSRDSFIKRHVRYETTSSTDQYGRNQSETKISGYRGLDQVKARIAPIVLRRTADDLKDAKIPDVVTNDVFLDLYRPQRAKYKELQDGVLTLLKDDQLEVKHVAAIAMMHYGSAICAGLSALGEDDGPGTSVKFDWVTENIRDGGVLGDEKVVIFSRLKNSVRSLHNRFDNIGVKYVTVWGEDADKSKRAEAQQQFWDDPETRVLIGTSAIEQSLNLQVARHLINVDMILNPERMTQLAGRVRRLGSEHSHVFVHNLLTNNTHEERFLPLLEREAALSSYIWEEKSLLFKELSPVEMLRMITG